MMNESRVIGLIKALGENGTGGGGGGIVFVDGTIDPNAEPEGDEGEERLWLIPSKSVEECQKLVASGNYLIFRFIPGEGLSYHLPLLAISPYEDSYKMVFSASVNGGIFEAELNPSNLEPVCAVTMITQ
jgi:hypothetical protein